MAGVQATNEQQLITGSYTRCRCPLCQVGGAQGKKYVDCNTGKRLHSCRFKNCGKIFDCTTNLSLHLLMHEEEKNYESDFCGLQSTQTAAMASHVQNLHGNGLFGKFECLCPFCQIADAGGIKNIDSSTGKRLHTCYYETCGKIFRETLSLVAHSEEHVNSGEWDDYVENYAEKADFVQIKTNTENDCEEKMLYATVKPESSDDFSNFKIDIKIEPKLEPLEEFSDY